MTPSPLTFPDRGQADQFASRRVCARCYGDLLVLPSETERTWEASCPACGDAWGYTTVSRAHAEHLGQRALAEKNEVATNLPDLFPNPHKGKTAEQIIREMGL